MQQRNAICLIDSHCHIDDDRFDADRDELLAAAAALGVGVIWVPAVHPRYFARVKALTSQGTAATNAPRLFPAYGLHPCYVDDNWQQAVTATEAFVRSEGAWAIGEIGVDGYPGAPPLAWQIDALSAQLKLAQELDLPVLLHARHAVETLIQTLGRVWGRRPPRPPCGVVHAFNGSDVQAERLIKTGFLLGFGGALSFDGSRRIRRLAERLPISAIVLETDAPDMAPVWRYARALPASKPRNEPADLAQIAAVLADLRQLPLSTLAAATTANAQRLMAR